VIKTIGDPFIVGVGDDKDFSIEFDKQIIEKAYNTLKNL
jgi:hypothetical protein